MYRLFVVLDGHPGVHTGYHFGLEGVGRCRFQTARRLPESLGTVSEGDGASGAIVASK